jgi:predicted nicotinamide N-methyase
VNERAFVTKHTRLQEVPGLGALKLHLSDDVFSVWKAVQERTGDPDAPIPFWAFAWGGGLAIASYVRDHPDAVTDTRVLDFASGSGLCAIAALRAGASNVEAIDVDPFAIAAVELNARANRVRIDARRDDLLDRDPPDVDVILAGDCWYEESFGTRLTAWLWRAREAHDGLIELASYDVRSTTDLEDMARTRAWVYELSDR